LSEIDDGAAVKGADSLAPANAAPKPFEPIREVMAEVDEKIVETEKAAVRSLLDVRDAKELDAFVNMTATSASQGEWTYFKISVLPRSQLKVVPKDVVILLDASGSIANDRLKSCRNNAKKILRSCMNSHDRFNLVAFRDDFRYAFKTWQDCGQESYDRAERWLNSLAAYGRTDVFASAASVLKLPRDPKRPLIALIVTDGIANKGVRETSQILSRFTKLNDGLISVYMYGVKDDANRELIDVLTRGNRGESFIFEGSRFEAGSGIDALSERFRDPLLSDLRIVFSSATEAETYPRLLRNLYRGCPVYVYGRAPKGTKEISFSLKGLSAEQAYESFFTFSVENAQIDDALPYLWRQEKSIGYIQRQK
jgi:Mg-chelatase subunit ChlD